MKRKSIAFLTFALGCTALFAESEVILSDNDVIPKDAGTKVFVKNAPQKKTGASYKWTVVTDKEMVKTSKSGRPDMTDGVALHGAADANSVFTHGKCTAEAVFDLKNKYPLTRVAVFFRIQTDHKHFNVSKLKVFTSDDSKSFKYAGSELSKNAALVRTIGKSQLWKIELKLQDKKARHVKVRLEKDARSGFQIVLSEMVIYGMAK